MKRIINEIKQSVGLYLIILGIILQVIWLLVTLNWLSGLSIVFSTVMTIISTLTIIWILNNSTTPEIKLAWVIFILVFPLIGGIVFFIVEGNISSINAKKRYAATRKDTDTHNSSADEILREINAENPNAASQYAYLLNNGFPIYKQTQCKYYPMADTAYPELLDALRQAEQSIFLEYFIISNGNMWMEILQILISKARDKVDVRILFDDFASQQLLPNNYCKTLTGYGIRSAAFNPVLPLLSVTMNNRDHRKIAVIDGKTAFIGGFNLSDEYINLTHPHGTWKDIGVKLQGDAVQSIVREFFVMWNFVTDGSEDFSKHLSVCPPELGDGYIQPYAYAPYNENLLAEKVYLNIINQACHYLYIYTPYLIIDHKMQNALIMAAERGADVRLILPGIPDKKLINSVTKSNYPELIYRGVGIYEYEPGFVHAKGIVCDDILATVGSANLDYRSLYHHFENGCLFYKSKVVMDLKFDFKNTLKDCKKIAAAHQNHRRLLSSFYSLLRTFSPLL